jgi:NAD(P)-dependent dehydrogenase (short-subunit alcohol dehydrogenase family)
MASRSQQKAEQAIAGLQENQPDARVYFLDMDLTDLESVKKAVETFLAFVPQLKRRKLKC